MASKMLFLFSQKFALWATAASPAPINSWAISRVGAIADVDALNDYQFYLPSNNAAYANQAYSGYISVYLSNQISLIGGAA